MSADALVVPSEPGTAPLDAELIALAELFGIRVVRLPLAAIAGTAATSPGSAAPLGRCVALNAALLRRALTEADLSPALGRRLAARFPFRFVYGLEPDPFGAAVARCFSDGHVHAVRSVPEPGAPFRVAPDAGTIGDVFAGLAVGSTSPEHDRVLLGDRGGPVRPLVAVDGRPVLAAIETPGATTFLLGRNGLADIRTPAAPQDLDRHFGGVVPALMMLRHVFPDRCWRPRARHATLIVDDPLLRETYGHLDYAGLLRLMQEHDFHTTIAFIPYNRHRTSPAVGRLFRDHPDRYSLCFHGNDHTGAEFGQRRAGTLDAALRTARDRMHAHEATTGVPSDEVMVFPQGVFCREALAALTRHNYVAAVNSHAVPDGEAAAPRLADLLAPALRIDTPTSLFLRRYVADTTPARVALDFFLGKPVLIAGHHDLFRAPSPLLDAVASIRSIAPDVRWTSIARSLAGSWLGRGGAGDALHVRAYATTVTIPNPGATDLPVSVEWWPGRAADVDAVGLDGGSCSFDRGADGRVHARATIGPRRSGDLRIRYREGPVAPRALGQDRSTVRVYLRRRLSELRDEYLSRSPALLATAARLRRRLVSRA